MPFVIDPAADREFRKAAADAELDPLSLFVGGYADREWERTRPYLEAYAGRLDGVSALEVGCNIGATTCVLSALGARVTAIDTNPKMVRLARLNAARYGATDATFAVVAPGANLPYETSHFSLVTCNSVLEYIAPSQLPGTLAEIDRVLAPGGVVIVMGTSNRVFPREVHSGGWLGNYLPASVDRFIGRRQRGIFPWQVTRALSAYSNIATEKGMRHYLEVRRRVGDTGVKLLLVAAITLAGRFLGSPPGGIMPSFFLALRKPPP